MERDTFVFYRSYWEQAKEMNKNDRLKFLEAICELALNGNETELKGTPKIAFIGAKPQVIANNKKYESGVKGASHGKKGGRPKKGDDGDSNKNPSGVIEENPYGVNEKTPNDNVNDNVNEKENDNDNVNDNGASANTKHKFGEYHHVLLTDDQYQKLMDEYPNHEELITFLDEYIEMKGYKAKNHYLAIKKWVVDAVKERQQKNKQLPSWYYEQDASNEEEPSISNDELMAKLQELRHG